MQNFSLLPTVRALPFIISFSLLSSIMFNSKATAQQSTWQKFMQLHLPEKIWVVTHPFVARKAWRITQQARTVAAQMKHDTDLDGDDNGGQVDAFRHAFWMASLAQQIHWRKALSLGRAHERGNRIDYRKRKTEEGTIPDFPSSDMDLRNNKVGAEIGRKNKKATQEQLVQLVKGAILRGEMWKIKKDAEGNFLDWQGNLLMPKQYQHKWHNDKCLVPSNYVHPSTEK